MAVLGWTGGAAALVAVGVVLGASLTSSAVPNAPHNPQNSAQPFPPPNGPPPAPRTVCGKVQPHPGSALCMVGQSQGPATAAFTVRGTGFAPRATVTVTILGADPQGVQMLDTTSRVHPVVGRNGTFSFTIRQVYSGSLQLGQFTVDAREANGREASTVFMVVP